MLKKLLPWRVTNWLELRQRAAVLDKSFSTFFNNPKQCLDDNNTLLIDLFFGWGNQAWSAEKAYLKACIENALTTKGAILECGSGLSTLIIGGIAKQRNLPHVVLEHIPEWADKIYAQINKYKLTNTQIVNGPIKQFGDYAWYDPRNIKANGKFDLVICDGPPSDVAGGRYGLIPVMHEKLNSGCIILLDDADREQEHQVAKQWKQEFATTYLFSGHKKPYFTIEMP